MPNIAIVSTFLPTQCGIATYATDLIQALESKTESWLVTKIELTALEQERKDCGIIRSTEQRDFLQVSEYLNTANIDIVDIQHEFKIYGKPDGENILLLLNHVKKPIATTLHTVSSSLNEPRMKILQDIANRSDLLYVFSQEAKNIIVQEYGKSKEKVEVIPHGVPHIPLKKTWQIPLRKQFSSPLIFISAGHMRESKGYNVSLQALHGLKKDFPDFHYLILGSNHPQNETVESYRKALLEQAAELNLSEQITFIEEYLDINDLIQYIQLSDVCLLPYTREDQSSSGVLALMIACGRPVISTPFSFAKSHVTGLSGAISNSFTYADFELAIRTLLNRKDAWNAIGDFNHKIGLTWRWNQVVNSYISGYKKLIPSEQ